jgi:poly(3-hydroxybutyrate) depolymerase
MDSLKNDSNVFIRQSSQHPCWEEMSMNLKMTGVISLFCTCILLESAFGGKSKSYLHEIFVDGLQRSYIVYEPLTSTEKKLPLMIVLHGGLGNAQHMAKSTAMNEVADTGPFVVVYPNGVKINRRYRPKNSDRHPSDICDRDVKRCHDGLSSGSRNSR